MSAPIVVEDGAIVAFHSPTSDAGDERHKQPLTFDADAGNLNLDTAPTTADLQRAFANFLQVDVANGDATEDTVAAYFREVLCWTRWCHTRGLNPIDARRADVETYRESLKARGLSTSTRSHKLSIIRRFYAAAIKHDLLEANPAGAVRGGKDSTPPEEKMKALTLTALSSLAAAVPSDTLSGKRDRAIIALMALHGLRRIEVHRLNHESLDESGEMPSLRIHGKGNRIRRVFLRPDTHALIQAYIEAKLHAKLPLSEALFLAHGNRTRGERLARRSLNLIVDKHLSSAALKKDGVSCHALRHTHGTLAVAGGAKIEHLRDAMGHSKIETTSLYVKAVERIKHNPAASIDVEF